MAWFSDLSPCSYFGAEYADCLRAVGWLERGQSFDRGAVDGKVYQRLKELLHSPWQPFLLMGHHGCQLCRYEPRSHGSENLFLPGEGAVFVSPELILHYMNEHDYAPPQEFCQAVLCCPEMGSAQYFKALLKCGARALVFEGKE